MGNKVIKSLWEDRKELTTEREQLQAEARKMSDRFQYIQRRTKEIDVKLIKNSAAIDEATNEN